MPTFKSAFLTKWITECFMSHIVTKVSIAISACLLSAYAQSGQRDPFAVRLVNPDTRQETLDEIRQNRDKVLPRLLAWAKELPSGFNEFEQRDLQIIMAEIFGNLRVEEAIPFLIANISLDKGPMTNVWGRTPEVIQARLPGVAALIAIGPEAARTLIATPRDRMSPYDRLAAVFVVSRIGGVPGAREYLNSALGEATALHYRAEEGLRYLESHPELR
jgi:hypothetical protein